MFARHVRVRPVRLHFEAAISQAQVLPADTARIPEGAGRRTDLLGEFARTAGPRRQTEGVGGIGHQPGDLNRTRGGLSRHQFNPVGLGVAPLDGNQTQGTVGPPPGPLQIDRGVARRRRRELRGPGTASAQLHGHYVAAPGEAGVVIGEDAIVVRAARRQSLQQIGLLVGADEGHPPPTVAGKPDLDLEPDFIRRIVVPRQPGGRGVDGRRPEPSRPVRSPSAHAKRHNQSVAGPEASLRVLGRYGEPIATAPGQPPNLDGLRVGINRQELGPA